MKNSAELIETSINEWRLNKGVGTVLIPNVLNDKSYVFCILQKLFHSNKHSGETYVVTNTFNERNDLVEYINEQNDSVITELLNKKTIKIVSRGVIDNNPFIVNAIKMLVILYHIESYDDRMLGMLRNSRFKLSIMNYLTDDKERNKLYKLCPLLNPFKSNEIEAIKISTPVEETLVSVDINNAETQKTLNQYNEFISTSISIFSDFETISKARVGDRKLNLSAMQVCANIATANGWNEHLDMSVEYNRQIDNLYNPNALNERAHLTYDIIRKRSQLLTDYEEKLDKICELVEEHKDERILIISKRGEFASIITDFLNEKFGTVCANYHDKVDNMPGETVDGKPIFIKTGEQKGNRKMFGVTKQKTLAKERFRNGYINVLSTSNSPDVTLDLDFTMVVITSPLCNEIENYKYRLNKVNWGDKIMLYTIYCKNTMEERHIISREPANNHVVINNIENNIAYNENFDFITED